MNNMKTNITRISFKWTTIWNTSHNINITIKMYLSLNNNETEYYDYLFRRIDPKQWFNTNISIRTLQISSVDLICYFNPMTNFDISDKVNLYIHSIC